MRCRINTASLSPSVAQSCDRLDGDLFWFRDFRSLAPIALVPRFFLSLACCERWWLICRYLIVLERRERLGDFEGDLVLCQPGSGGLLTVVDRRSRFLCLEKVHNKTARHVHEQFRQALPKLPADKRHSTTFDNGTEFARCHLVEKTHGSKLYFADPGCPHQRGTNENTNGRLRQFFPKGIDFRTITWADIRRVETLMNNRPRKCLGYRTPAEVFLELSP